MKKKKTTLDAGDWDIHVSSKVSLFRLDLRSVFQYRFLMVLFVKRDFVAQFKQTILGPFWFILQPVLTSGIFTIVFSMVAKISTDGVPPFLFNLAGVTLWNYFASCLTSTSNVLGSNANLFGKVYFPRLTVPFSIVMTRFYAFGIQFVFFIIVFLVMWIGGTPLAPNWVLLALPLVVAHTALLGLGIGLIISAFSIKYRDLLQLVGFGVTLWMYISPIFYPLSAVPASLRPLVAANPMAPVIEVFRYSFTGVGELPVVGYFVSLVGTSVLLLVGLALFHRAERNYVDVA